jgi:peptidoglycan/xylan/chitin deacetylase (PgdA/CDA1 family)
MAVLIATSLALAGCQKSTATAMPTESDPTAAYVAQSLTPILSTASPSPEAATATLGVETTQSTTTPSPIPTVTFTPAASVEMVTVPMGKIILPILLYHHVSDQGSGRYVVPTKTFREQMETLKKEGYATITISQLADTIRSGGELPVKPIVLTFDDGYLDTSVNAFPILHESGYIATVYIITGTLGTKLSYGYMQADDLKALVSAGWEVGSHSVTHNDLHKTKLGAGNELKQSKKTLEDLLGVKVRSFSFPFGIADKSLKDLAAASGYDSGVGLDELNTHTSKQLYFLSRREVYRSLSLAGFEQLLHPSQSDNIIATQSAAATPTP